MRGKTCRALLLVLCAMIPWLSGCQLSAYQGVEETVRPRAVITPAPTLTNAPATLYSSVLTEKRVVSIVLEGYTDDKSMRALISLLKSANIPCVFFVSGIDADEHPDVIKEIEDAGFSMGNYGLNAEKNMEDNDIKTNIHQFQRGQDLIYEVTGLKPALFRCNGTKYTDDVLKAAAYVGLQAGVNPGTYLNHRSFSDRSNATLYVQRLTRGAVISVKLGQELDGDEYDGAEESMRYLAIDPQPFLSDNMEELLNFTYENVVNVVSWLISALNSEGYIVLSPDALQAEKMTMFDTPAQLSEETLSLLNSDLYDTPNTPEALGAATGAAAGDTAFDGAVFVGDSITAGIGDYVAWRRESQPEYLGTSQFLTTSNLGVIASEMRITATSVHPEVDGVKMTIDDAIKALDAKTVYLTPGLSDVRSYTKEKLIENLKLMIYQIRRQNPDTKVILQSIPPGIADRYTEPANDKIFRYNLAVAKFCLQYDIPFVDVAYALRNETGDLMNSLCIDPDTYGIHLNDAGCEKWIDYIRTHVPNQ